MQQEMFSETYSMLSDGQEQKTESENTIPDITEPVKEDVPEDKTDVVISEPENSTPDIPEPEEINTDVADTSPEPATDVVCITSEPCSM